TDHSSLQYVQTQKQLDRRKFRWMQELVNFNFTILYQPGSTNKADALSRMPDAQLIVLQFPVTRAQLLDQLREGSCWRKRRQI
ncbi:MAG: hypothetical protein ACRDL7_07160, partial [Gaiellaceae bacterium]